MSKFATVRNRALVWGSVVLLAASAAGQTRVDWRHVGNSAVDLGLAGLASGPVDRVWYSNGGIRIRTALGPIFETSDYDSWRGLPASTLVPDVVAQTAPAVPEDRSQIRVAPSDALRVYAFAQFVYRSDDGGKHWENLTSFKGSSIIGDGLRDLAVAPGNADEITVAGGAGVYRSVDGGRSWHGLNDSLPNLPGPRLLSVPGALIQVELADGLVIEWQAGERRAWTVSPNDTARYEAALREFLSQSLGATVTAVAVRGNYVYAGDVNGRLSVSSDGFATWLHSPDPRRGRVNEIWVDPQDGRVALAVFASRPNALVLEPQTVLHTINAGQGWDTVSGGLPAASISGVTADRAANAVYIASDVGVFATSMSLATLGARPLWTMVPGLPGARVSDVRLDEGMTQLWATVEGSGLYATLAPHRLSDPLVVSAADLVSRAAAPGSLLSVAGARVVSATAGGQDVPVLAANDTESQLQLPFTLTGTNLALAIRGPQGSRELAPIPLQAVAPGIFEVDGSPLLLDADRGVMLDGMNPARSRMRVQVMTAGLGRVRPDWPAGTPAPADNTPQVVAPVSAYWNREPVEVLRAVLAPGFTGVYLVEFEVPVQLQYGVSELYIQVNGQESNRVRVYSEP